MQVRARRRDNDLVVSVEDFGPGIDDRDLERVFAKFEHGTNEGPGGGVGLGLAICRSIVRLHGGQSVGRESAGRRQRVPLHPADRGSAIAAGGGRRGLT